MAGTHDRISLLTETIETCHQRHIKKKKRCKGNSCSSRHHSHTPPTITPSSSPMRMSSVCELEPQLQQTGEIWEHLGTPPRALNPAHKERRPDLQPDSLIHISLCVCVCAVPFQQEGSTLPGGARGLFCVELSCSLQVCVHSPRVPMDAWN